MDSQSQVQIWGQSDNGEYEYVTLTPSLLDKALDVIREGFIPNESVSIACGIPDDPEAGEELIELCKEVAKDGVSLVAVHKASGEVVSVAFNKIQRKPKTENEPAFYDAFIKTKCKRPPSKALIKFMLETDCRYDLFEHYKVDILLELMFIATKPNFRQKGLGLGVCKAIFKFIKSYEKEPLKVVTALFTSPKSQMLGDKLNFDCLLKVPYSEYKIGDKTFADVLGETIPCTTLSGIRIE